MRTSIKEMNYLHPLAPCLEIEHVVLKRQKDGLTKTERLSY